MRRKDQKALYDHMQIEKQLAQTNSPGESAMPGGQEAVPASYSCQACKRPWTEEVMQQAKRSGGV